MSTIKSEKAKEYIDAQRKQRGRGRLHMQDTFNAVCIAEQDAEARDRDRAVRAHEKSCPYHDYGREYCWRNNASYEKEACTSCNYIKQFLKAYDNE